MPMYEYECKTCNQVFEIIQKFSDPVLTKKPDCDKNCQLTKLVSKTSFQLKGSGWYATDYKKSSSSPSTSSNKTTESPAKTETKDTSTPTPPATGHKCSGGNCH